MWETVGSLTKYSNQGTEAANHFHQVISDVMSQGKLGKKSRSGCLLLLKPSLASDPDRKKELLEFLDNEYSVKPK
jgi:hypothetical protein